MLIFLQKYFLKDFLKNSCIWVKFCEALCDIDKNTKKEYKDDHFLWRFNLICTYADPLIANKLPRKSISFFKFIYLLKKFIWRGKSWNPVTTRMDKEPSVARTQSNIQERSLSESNQRPKVVNYFRTELHVRHSTGLSICLWPRHGYLWTEIYVTQLFIENIVLNFEKPSKKDMRNNKRSSWKYLIAQSHTFDFNNKGTRTASLTWMSLTSLGSSLI